MDIQSLFSVKDKVVVVTGGSRGIGLMIAEGFVANGAKVYITSRNAKACAQAEKELNDKGLGKCVAIPGDLQDYEQVKTFAEKLSELEPNGIDILVNNAGANWAESIDTYPDKGFSKVLNLNLQRVFTLTQLLLPLLEKAATEEIPARVINVGSIDGMRVAPQETYAYGASKAGLHHLTRSLAANLGNRNITVNAIAPGPFESKMMEHTLKTQYERIVSNVPLGRIGAPHDMAGVCIYLSSKAGSYVNGAVFQVDGGSAIKPHM